MVSNIFIRRMLWIYVIFFTGISCLNAASDNLCHERIQVRKHLVGKSYFDGILCDGIPHGEGTLTDKYGVVSRGSFVDGIFSGEVVSTRPDGSKLVGEYVNGKKHGRFVYVSPKGYKQTYFYRRGVLVGMEEDNNLSHYVGAYNDIGQRDGYGVLTYPNQDVYKGNWKNGVEEGEGTYYFKDGSIFKGHYVNGKREGYGRLELRNSYIYEGTWKEGKPDGYGKKIYSNGCTYQGKFVKGRAIKKNNCEEVKEVDIDLNVILSSKEKK